MASTSTGRSRFFQSHRSWSTGQRRAFVVGTSAKPSSAAAPDLPPLTLFTRGTAWCTTTPSKVRSPGPGAACVPGGGRKFRPGM
eukprot:scaffold735_cov255-Pinguiococcus_pyrenoidosus.AAC.7